MSALSLYVYKAAAIRTIDGDSVILDLDLGCGMWLRGERCRLSGIDTPEIYGGTQPGGLEAKAWLEQQLAKCDRKVIVRTAKSKDKYGRWLAEIFVPGSNVSLNEQMIANGLAKRYV